MKKAKHYFQTSLRNQFIGLMSSFILIFLAGSICLFAYDRYITNEYQEQKVLLDQKQEVAEQLDRSFKKAFFDARGYIAFGRQEFKDSIYSEEEVVLASIKKLKKLSTDEQDVKFVNDAEEFASYYFDILVENAFYNFENDDIEAVMRASEDGATATINTFQKQLDQYNDSLQEASIEEYEAVKKKETFSQQAFVLFIFIMLLALMRMMRVIARQIGLPLNEVASAAEKISENESYQQWSFANERKDEIGKLSRAFEKMIYKIQEKEESLLSQNEELVAQQDELESQQSELEHLLAITKNREQQLERRNEFIHGISTSLNKQKVLDSIVRSMSRVMDASCGMIVLMDEQDSHAAFGISKSGVSQFIEYMDNGIHQRLFETKKAFTIKRELGVEEKGYHEGTLYSYDLFIPILSPNLEVEAVMVFSRFGQDFDAQELDEYMSLAKQVSISLQKIHLFEESEKDRRITQDILSNIQEGIHLVDRQGNTLLMNATLSKVINGDFDLLQKATYKEWKQMLLPQVEDEEGMNHYYEMVMTQEVSGKNVHTYHLKDTKRVYQVYSEPLYRGEDHVGTIFVHRDITKEFEVDQMKSEFVSTVSHELRTPLSSVLGFTELMLTKDLKPERTKKYLTTIYQEAKRLTSLINDFLDVQRMESGRQTFEKRYEDLTPILETVIENQKVNAPSHQFVIEKETDCTIVLGDKDKLSQAFTNLISNAIKYSPDGGHIFVRLREDDDRIHIDIEDEGLGVPEEAIPNLFTKFYRVDNSDRRRIGGTGLGLTIVKEIVETHEGSIHVSSELGEGTTFTVTLPVVTMEIFKEEEQCGNGMEIMVIEDDVNLATLLRTELSESGFQVQHTKSGKEALEKMKEINPCAIVLDIMLEGNMSGWDVLEKIKEDETLSEVPIIISSALEEKEKGMTLGANEYLVKPYQPSKLSKTVLHLLLKNGLKDEIQ